MRLEATRSPLPSITRTTIAALETRNAYFRGFGRIYLSDNETPGFFQQIMAPPRCDQATRCNRYHRTSDVAGNDGQHCYLESNHDWSCQCANRSPLAFCRGRPIYPRPDPTCIGKRVYHRRVNL